MIRAFTRMLGAFLWLGGAPALAANWVEITRLSDGTVVSVDTESVAASPPLPYARDFPAVQVAARYGPAGGATAATTFNSIDCAGKTITALRITHYASDGSVTRRWSRVDYDFNYRPVNPDTVGDAILRFVCSAAPRGTAASG